MSSKDGRRYRFPDNLWRRTERRGPDDCWLYTGDIDAQGYGRVSIKGRKVAAHRAAYELLVGPIPEGMELDHVRARGCLYRNCVNPAHLEPVTHAENTERGNTITSGLAATTHCSKGHEYTPENTRIDPVHGTRQCRRCRRDRGRRNSRDRRARARLTPFERALYGARSAWSDEHAAYIADQVRAKR